MELSYHPLISSIFQERLSIGRQATFLEPSFFDMAPLLSPEGEAMCFHYEQDSSDQRIRIGKIQSHKEEEEVQWEGDVVFTSYQKEVVAQIWALPILSCWRYITRKHLRFSL